MVFSGPRPPETPVIWQPPHEGFLKANFDVFVAADGSGVGLGVVIRDWRGSVLVWRHRRVPHIKAPEIGEALAARCAVQLARENHYCNMIFEGDS